VWREKKKTYPMSRKEMMIAKVRKGEIAEMMDLKKFTNSIM
jgi:hypothetical protein